MKPLFLWRRHNSLIDLWWWFEKTFLRLQQTLHKQRKHISVHDNLARRSFLGLGLCDIVIRFALLAKFQTIWSHWNGISINSKYLLVFSCRDWIVVVVVEPIGNQTWGKLKNDNLLLRNMLLPHLLEFLPHLFLQLLLLHVDAFTEVKTIRLRIDWNVGKSQFKVWCLVTYFGRFLSVRRLQHCSLIPSHLLTPLLTLFHSNNICAYSKRWKFLLKTILLSSIHCFVSLAEYHKPLFSNLVGIAFWAWCLILSFTNRLNNPDTRA